ncbi:MAG: LytTR family transcriptional regulator [Ruminococcaceae bacterium]|jgi:two-component system response regulator LytT|nr:LytTR family transcriptional regulator [Oscillospiraceae bacterium]
MKIRISVSREKQDAVREYLESHGVEISDDSEYLITEFYGFPEFLSVRNERKERLNIAVNEVVFIESFRKDIEVHTTRETYWAQDRMYQLERLLDPKEFLRVSKSVIISKRHVKKIRPTLSMKYTLTMTEGTLVDVTRSYYNDFRRFFNI